MFKNEWLGHVSLVLFMYNRIKMYPMSKIDRASIPFFLFFSLTILYYLYLTYTTNNL